MTLEIFFQENPEVALAFSGGADSAYLLYEALRHAKRVQAYYVSSVFQPQFEREDARRIAKELGAKLTVLSVDVLSHEAIRSNPPDRCYHCKQVLFRTILKAAAEDGFSVLADGTNASDEAADRPGMRALSELSVRSPLREANLTKADIRKASQAAGLFTWNKPAYACLATRIAAGEEITAETLSRIEQAEDYLFSLGFSDFRVRTFQGHARIELPKEQTAQLLSMRGEIGRTLSAWFQSVSLDLRERT